MKRWKVGDIVRVPLEAATRPSCPPPSLIGAVVYVYHHIPWVNVSFGRGSMRACIRDRLEETTDDEKVAFLLSE